MQARSKTPSFGPTTKSSFFCRASTITERQHAWTGTLCTSNTSWFDRCFQMYRRTCISLLWLLFFIFHQKHFTKRKWEENRYIEPRNKRTWLKQTWRQELLSQKERRKKLFPFLSVENFNLRQDPLDLSFWSFFTFLHHGIEEIARHLLWKFYKKNSNEKLVKCATEVARLHRVSIQSCTQNRPSPKVQSLSRDLI